MRIGPIHNSNVNSQFNETFPIQSAHWSHTQVTVYTVVVWTISGTYSFVILSDYLSHDKYAVCHFNNLIISAIRERMNENLEVIDIFSDGAAQHFKQRYTFYSATLHLQQGLKINWHFFATSHGKGAVDGVGGTVKRSVCTAIKTRKYHITTASDYATCARQVLDKIKVLYVSADEINTLKEPLNDRWKNIRSLPGTHDVHCIRSLESGVIEYSMTSDQPGKQFHLLQHTMTIVDDLPATELTATNECATDNKSMLVNIKVGDWVAAIYDDNWYPGLVEAAVSDKLTVSFMEKTGQRGKFCWPEKKDVQILKDSEILYRLPTPPAPTGRSSRIFDVTDWKQIDSIFFKV